MKSSQEAFEVTDFQFYLGIGLFIFRFLMYKKYLKYRCHMYTILWNKIKMVQVFALQGKVSATKAINVECEGVAELTIHTKRIFND